MTVLLRSQKDGINDGIISTIIVQTPEGEQTVPHVQALSDWLKGKLDRGELTKKDIVQIQAESRLKYAFVIEAVDACRKVGVEGVGFTPPPDADIR